MDKQYPSPINDFVFKKIFTKNLDVLKAFLTAALPDIDPDEFESVTLLDPTLEPEYAEDKLGVLDIKILTRSRKVINVEVQVRPQRALWKRSLFYASGMVVEQLKKGDPYENISSVISIVITDFVVRPDRKAYRSRFRMYDVSDGEQYPETFEIHILELPKMRSSDGTALGDWMLFFNARTRGEFMEVAKKCPAIGKAWATVEYLSGDAREKAMARLMEKVHRDRISQMHDSLMDGVELGMQRGRMETQYDIARSLLRMKIPFDGIADATGLPLAEVNRLAAEQDAL